MTNTIKIFGTVAVLAFHLAIAGCGGGGGSAEAPPTPPVSAFLEGVVGAGDRLTVSGIRLDASAAVVVLDNVAGSAADLKPGMVVRVKAKVRESEATGIAEKIEFSDNLEGRIEEKRINAITVLGQLVIVDKATFLEDGGAAITFSQLAVGDRVEVSGFPFRNGTIRATRIERRNGAGGDFEVKGTVGGYSPGDNTFTLTPPNSERPLAVVLGAGGSIPPRFGNGAFVEVSTSGTAAGFRIAATRVRIEEVLKPSEGDLLRVQGIVSGLSPSQFNLGGLAVRTVSSLAITLSDDAAVQADGRFQAGALVDPWVDRIALGARNWIAFGSNASCFGDSITAGVGASEDRYRYANIISAENGWILTNKAMSGSYLAGQIAAVYSETVAGDGNSFILSGYNDMRCLGTAEGGQAYFGNALTSALAWLAIADVGKVRGRGDARVDYTGRWTDSPMYGVGRYTDEPGATASFTVAGTAIYICALAAANNDGTFSVSVDGVERGSYVCAMPDLRSPDITYAPLFVRIAGLSSGPHRVVVTVTSSSGNVYFDWAAGIGGTASPAGPNVFVGNTLRMNLAGYAAGGAPWTSGSDAAVALFNATIRDAGGLLAADGLNVVPVDASSAYDPATADVSWDNIHPADQGMAKIAKAFLARIDAFSYIRLSPPQP